MATLGEIVAAAQGALASIDVASIPASPPDTIGDAGLPALVVYPVSGGFRIETAAGAETGGPEKWGAHTVNADLHIGYQRTMLAIAVAAAIPLLDPIVDALLGAFLATKFAGTVTTLGTAGPLPVRYQLVAMRWGGRETIGFRFQLDVTAESAIE